jgi:hypothetical protein
MSGIIRFHLHRREDESGVSGTGVVAEGVRFSDGRCVLRWLTAVSSIAIYDSIEDLIAIHGHKGKTILQWEETDLPCKTEE